MTYRAFERYTRGVYLRQIFNSLGRLGASRNSGLFEISEVDLVNRRAQSRIVQCGIQDLGDPFRIAMVQGLDVAMLPLFVYLLLIVTLHCHALYIFDRPLAAAPLHDEAVDRRPRS